MSPALTDKAVWQSLHVQKWLYFSLQKTRGIGYFGDHLSSFPSLETHGKWAAKTLNGPFLFPNQFCPSEPWGWHRLLGCSVNTLCPTWNFKCLSSSGQQGRQGLSCIAKAQSISSSSLNCSGCPNTWRCSSGAPTVLISWLVHQSSLVMMGLAGRSRGAGCWTCCSGC